jgi:hypothetical protein
VSRAPLAAAEGFTRPCAQRSGAHRRRETTISLLIVPQSKSKRSRYTPPPAKKAEPSKLWVPVALTTLLACGLAVIVLNYLNLLPGADTENRYLLLGIALISGGFLIATNYR